MKKSIKPWKKDWLLPEWKLVKYKYIYAICFLVIIFALQPFLKPINVKEQGRLFYPCRKEKTIYIRGNFNLLNLESYNEDKIRVDYEKRSRVYTEALGKKLNSCIAFDFLEVDNMAVFKPLKIKKTFSISEKLLLTATHSSSQLDATLHIPENLRLNLKLNKGNIFINNFSGSGEIFTEKGDITLTNVKGNLKVKTLKGNIIADSLDGKFKLEALAGKVKLGKYKGFVLYTDAQK